MKTILVTGATGYLGRYLADSFLSKGYKIIALHLNKDEKIKFNPKFKKNIKKYYLDKTSIKTIFKENKIDIIIHTATLYGRNNESVSKIIDSNIIFPVDILSSACDNKVGLFINTDTILNKNINYYSLTKSHFFDWMTMFCDRIKCVNIKLEHFYGPHDNPVKFVAWLIQKFKKNADSINLTDGLQKRDFIYIDDVISAFDFIVKNKAKMVLGKINEFEAGTGFKITIREFVVMLKDLMKNTNTKLNFGALPYRKDEVLNYDVDISGLRTLGWKPKVFIKDGLKKILKIEKGKLK